MALKDMEKSNSFKISGMLRGRIKGKQSIHLYTVYIQMYNILQMYSTVNAVNVCVRTYWKYVWIVYIHCSVVHCMHFDFPIHTMYMNTHSQTTHITLCVHM